MSPNHQYSDSWSTRMDNLWLHKQFCHIHTCRGQLGLLRDTVRFCWAARSRHHKPRSSSTGEGEIKKQRGSKWRIKERAGKARGKHREYERRTWYQFQSHQYLTIYGWRAADEADTEPRRSAKLCRRLNPIFPPSHNWNSSQLLELNIYLKTSFKLLDSSKAQLCFVLLLCWF